jgi:alkanesulfonate monooxygenase SsuD/methylene tetrahydromethanopterin reductase-like flavin-dependent oxidoreductase (luciferase family)
VLFTGGADEAGVIATINGVRAAAVAAGRRAEDVKFIVQGGVVVGRTQEEAEAKLAQYQGHASIDGVLAHASLPFDPIAFPRETLLSDVVGADKSLRYFRRFGRGKTVGELIDSFGNLAAGPFFVVGTPEVVADEIERWLDEVGIDGINLRQFHSFDTAKDFSELVSPELRRRGRLREAYVAGESLRDRVFGNGDRLPERHQGTRYRGGAGLPAGVPESGDVAVSRQAQRLNDEQVVA